MMCCSGLAFSKDLSPEPCIITAPLTVQTDQLRISVSNQECLSDAPTLFEAGTPGERNVWWIYSNLGDQNLFLEDYAIKLTLLRFRLMQLKILFEDGSIIEQEITPEILTQYIKPFLTYEIPFTGNGKAIDTITIGINTAHAPYLFTTTFKSQTFDQQDNSILMLIIGAILGSQLAIIIYNLALFIFLRFQFQGVFLALALAFFVHSMNQLGIDNLLFPQFSSNTFQYIASISFATFTILWPWFYLSFIEDGKIPSYVRPAVFWLCLLLIIIQLYTMLAPDGYNTYALFLFNAVAIFTAAIVLYSIPTVFRRKSVAIWYYLFAFFIPFIAVIYQVLWYGMLWENNFIPESDFNGLLVPLGSSFMVIVLSLGIGNRLNIIKQERDVAKTQSAEYKKASQTDALTGAGNRRYLDEHLTLLSENIASGDNSIISFLLIDFDSFKKVNDQYGHDIGDAVLVDITAIITACGTKYCQVFRMGGEEFIVVYHPSSSALAMTLAEHICNAISAHSLTHIHPELQNTSVSVGVNSCELNQLDVNTLYSQADQALYDAKKSGKNQVKLYSAATREFKTTTT